MSGAGTDRGAADAAPARPLLPSRLVNGYETFLGGRVARDYDRFHRLAEAGQSPESLVSDAPTLGFDAGPGEMFVIRNIANLVSCYAPDNNLYGTPAAIDHAVLGLRVPHIVVLGHAHCGGVRAYAEADLDPYRKPVTNLLQSTGCGASGCWRVKASRRCGGALGAVERAVGEFKAYSHSAGGNDAARCNGYPRRAPDAAGCDQGQ